MSVQFQQNEQTLTAFLAGEIDHHTARQMRQAIDACVQTHKPHVLIMDFGQITFMDSSGIGLVMGRYKLMQTFGGKVKIANASPRIQRVMMLAGLQRLSVL